MGLLTIEDLLEHVETALYVLFRAAWVLGIRERSSRPSAQGDLLRGDLLRGDRLP